MRHDTNATPSHLRRAPKGTGAGRLEVQMTKASVDAMEALRAREGLSDSELVRQALVAWASPHPALSLFRDGKAPLRAREEWTVGDALFRQGLCLCPPGEVTSTPFKQTAGWRYLVLPLAVAARVEARRLGEDGALTGWALVSGKEGPVAWSPQWWLLRREVLAGAAPKDAWLQPVPYLGPGLSVSTQERDAWDAQWGVVGDQYADTWKATHLAWDGATDEGAILTTTLLSSLRLSWQQ